MGSPMAADNADDTFLTAAVSIVTDTVVSSGAGLALGAARSAVPRLYQKLVGSVPEKPSLVAAILRAHLDALTQVLRDFEKTVMRLPDAERHSNDLPFSQSVRSYVEKVPEGSLPAAPAQTDTVQTRQQAETAILALLEQDAGYPPPPVFERAFKDDHSGWYARFTALLLNQIVQDTELQTLITLEEFGRTQDLVAAVQTRLDAVRDDIADFRDGTFSRLDDMQAKFDKLVDQNRQLARQVGIQEGQLIGVVRRYFDKTPNDFDAALHGIEEALRVYAEDRQKQKTANHPGAIDPIDAEIESLNAQDKFERTFDVLDQAFDSAEAFRIWICEKGIVQARLANDPEKAAKYALQKSKLEFAGHDEDFFNALRRLRRSWHYHGRDRGMRFDLTVGIHLARHCVEQAKNDSERATAQNDLGNAYGIQGERLGGQAGIDALNAAIEAYEAALTIYTEDDMPVDWAMTQNNIGTAYATQGERLGGQAGIDALNAAIEAYEAALTVHTKDEMPADWAMTQNNLGTAYRTQGRRLGGQAGIDALRAANKSFEAALTVFTEDAMPYYFEGTTENLEIARALLAEAEAAED